MPVRFSVVIPTFNRASTILPTLKSVRNQTFNNFECVIVDDGSKDVELLESIVEELGDPRFKVVRRSNGGGGAARNTGIDAASGAYIAFLDSDDLFSPNKLEESNAELSQTANGRGTVLFSQIIVDRGQSKTWVKPARAPNPGEPIDEYLILHGGFIQTSTIVIERSLACTVRFDESLPFGQDTDFCVRLARQGCNFRMLSRPLVTWKDDCATDRVSSSRKYGKLLEWTDRNRTQMTQRSYLAYRGWHAAKAARGVKPTLAARLYLTALFQGAFPPKLAIRAGLQLIIPPRAYRSVANVIVWLFGKENRNPS